LLVNHGARQKLNRAKTTGEEEEGKKEIIKYKICPLAM